MKIKKILLVLPIVFTLVLSLSCGLVVYADSIQDCPYSGELSALSCNEKLTDTESIYNATKNAYEARYSSDIELGSMPEFKFETYFYGVKITKYTSTDNYSGQIILLDIVDDTVQYEDDDMIIYNGQSMFYYYFSVENGVFTNANSYPHYLYTNNKNYNLIYDKANGFYFSQPNATTPDVCKTYLENPPAYYYLPVYVDTNLSNFPFADGTNHGTNGISADVIFTPPLRGELDRKIEQNGVEAESNYFSLQIRNNSSTAFQFVFAIVPKGSKVDMNASASNWNNGVDMSTADGIYYFSCNEWQYAPTLVKGNTTTAKSATKYYQSSIWHYVSSKSTYTRSFNWAQINIKKGIQYDAVVIGIPNNVGCSSRIFTASSSDYYVDLSMAQELYRSTFSVLNPVAYDPNNTEFGNTPNSGIIDVKNDSLVADGYIDSVTGETVISKVDFSDSLEAASNWTPGILSGNSSYSFDSFLSSSRSYLSFLNSAFSFFPDAIWVAISVGFFTIIVIGVLRHLG